MPAETMIQCEALTKRFGHFTAVDHVSFSVAKGSIFGFLGPNGTSKSTVSRVVRIARLSGFRIGGSFPGMKWTETIQRWRRLNAETRREICWRRIPRQVALSMAFEREAVDQSWLEKLHRQAGPPASFKPHAAFP